jgi:uncharacterized protein
MTKRSVLADRTVLAFLPMRDLFQQLRRAGLGLTIDQYELLRQALDAGFGLKSWEDLRDVCRVLWVKPGLDDLAETFEQVFDVYQVTYQKHLEDWFSQRASQESESESPLQETSLNVLPTVPLRSFGEVAAPETQTETETPLGEGMDAVKNDRPRSSKLSRDYEVKVPISSEVVRRTWRSLQRPIADVRLQELDLEATVERIGREGVFTELVQRSVARKKAELVLLVDDSNAMLPFAPVIQPLVQMVVARRIVPAQIYRFRQCPTDYLYEWQRPLQGEPLAKVLGRFNRLRTVVMIVSEAGAMSPFYEDDRVSETGQFLARVVPCVREVLWLNPLPRERWVGTTAESIQLAIGGRMISLALGDWQRLVKREFQASRPLAPNSGGT